MPFTDNLFFDLQSDSEQKEKVVNVYLIVSYFGQWLSLFSNITFLSITIVHSNVGIIIHLADPIYTIDTWHLVKYILGFVVTCLLIIAIICGFVGLFVTLKFIINFLMGKFNEKYGKKWIIYAGTSFGYLFCGCIGMAIFSVIYMESYGYGVISLFFCLFTFVTCVASIILSVSKYYLENKTGGISTNRDDPIDEEKRTRVELYVFAIVAAFSVCTIALISISSFVNKIGMVNVLGVGQWFLLFISIGITLIGCVLSLIGGFAQCAYSILGFYSVYGKFNKKIFIFITLGSSIGLVCLGVLILMGISILDIIFQNTLMAVSLSLYQWFIFCFGASPFLIIPITGCIGVFYTIFGGGASYMEVKNKNNDSKV